MKYLWFITLVTFPILFNCQSIGKEIKITPAELNEVLQSNEGIQLVDVRTQEEYQTSHLKNATNFDFYSKSFADSLKTLDRNKPVYVYCRSGGRSGKSVEQLKKLGFKEIYDLEGGILNWTDYGLEVSK
ncbi:rhodanese-like domain-containing protein [Flavobacteriaceae bacterium SZ-1-7]|uniref:rhodanese-like domain-containing protein n=1 Tax=Tamlana sedimenti TaxID=3134126 RepID=UPI0031292521